MKSLQKIEDRYISRGFRGKYLKRVLASDKKYLKLVGKRTKRLTANNVANAKDKKKYVLSTDDDFEILRIVKEIEMKELSPTDKLITELIKSQLEHDWRLPLLRQLRMIQKKYT